jgi:hypothetical protein
LFYPPTSSIIASMSSVHEVFDRIERWKASETLLQVTVREAGTKTDAFRCTICASDREAGLVGIVVGSHKIMQFDITGAQFGIGKRLIEASRTGDDLLVFEAIEDPNRDTQAARHIN